MADEDFLWPGGWKRDERGRWAPAGWVSGKDAGELLRRDAARWGSRSAGRARTTTAGRVLDFHSFRHSYVSSLDRAGLSEGLSRKLARASSRAILERYTHREFGELAAAVESLPAIAIPSGGDGSASETHADDAIRDEPHGAGSPPRTRRVRATRESEGLIARGRVPRGGGAR